MKKSAMIFISVLLILFTTTLVLSQSANFLLRNGGVRAAGMAGAYGAIANDASAMHYNPAGLARFQRFSAESNYLGWISDYNADLYQLYEGAALNVPKVGQFGISFKYIFQGERFHTLENDPTPVGTLSSHEFCIGLSYARNLSRIVCLGGTAKYIYSNLAPYGAGTEGDDGIGNAWAFDVGIIVQNFLPFLGFHREYIAKNTTRWSMHRIPPGPSIGVSISNMGTKMNQGDPSQANTLPQNLRISLAWNIIDMDVLGFLISADMEKLLVKHHKNGESDEFYQAWFTAWENGFEDASYSFGAELSAFTFASIRVGYNYREYDGYYSRYFDDYISFGVGLGPETVRFNFSYWFKGKGQSDSEILYLGLSLAY